MFRRSRFSIRPNVSTAGRAAATPQEVPSGSQEATETPRDVSEGSAATSVTDNKSVVTPSDKPAAPGDDQNGEGTSSSAAVQRRKRFSIKPKVASGRPPTLARTPKSPVKAVSETPVRVPDSDLDKSPTSSQSGTTAAPQGLRSPRGRRPSEESKQPKVQHKPTLLPSDSSAPSAVPPAEDSLEQTHVLEDSGEKLESTSDSQVKEVPSRLPVPPSLPGKEAMEISEKAKTIMSSKSGLSLSPPAFTLSRLLNDPSDLQRLAKAKKLKELLKQEMHKEKKIKKAKTRTTEYTLDPAKMTMRDLIRYLPVNNPMSSSLEDSEAQENETVVPPSPVREESPERAQEPEALPKMASPGEEEEEAEEDQEDALMVPQVKVAEDGSLIIDEESLTVEVQRAKGPNPAQDRDPIFERGSTTTYSSFRKGTYSKPWSNEETDMFFLAISMVGTDFSMICQLFPHRARSEIKNKFKKEERINAWRIDKAFRERRKLDIEYFSKLLEKILEVQQNRKKLKSLADKNSPKKNKRKAKGKKPAKKLKDVEEEDEEEEKEIPDGEEEEEGEKENEDLCNEGGAPVSKPKKKRKRKNIQDEEPNEKKTKVDEKSDEQDEADTPEDAEAALPEDRTSSDISEKTENVNAAKDTAIKPARLSRGRAPKPLLPLGRKWGKKPPPASSKGKDTASDKEGDSVSDGASKEKVNEDASPLRQDNKRKSDNDDVSAEEEEATVEPPRPTRYGRVPKPTKPLTYAAKEDAHSSVSAATPASPAGSTASAARPAKRARSSKQQSAQESKKPKLVTLRASRSEYSDEENEQQWEEEEVEEEQHPTCSSSKEGIASAFVPASLRSPHPVISEVEETMEELDILANMPDVLGISQDALCPDAFCEQAQNETGTAEPCEHQLDLLVDVIDFLSSEHTEVHEEESYNEAAHTLLTIGNLAHLSQSAQNQTGTASSDVNETSQHVEEEIASKPAAQEQNSATVTSATSCHAADADVQLQNSTTDNSDMSLNKTTDQRTGSDTETTAQLHSSPESSKKDSPQTRPRRLSKVKPKPNLGQASKTAQSKPQPETPTVRTALESHTVVPGLSQATESLSAAKETPDCNQDISCIEVKLTEEPSDGQVQSDQSQSFSEAQFEPSLEKTTRDSVSTSEITDETLMSHVGTAESSRSSPLTSDSVPESQVEYESNKDSASVQESSDCPAPRVTPEEELPVSQKEEGDIASTTQTRKSRFKKGKPKPNLAQTLRIVHSRPQPRKDSVEKDCNPTPNPKVHEKTVIKVEEEPTCTTFHEKPSQGPGPATDCIPLLGLGSTLTSTEELSATEEKKTDLTTVGDQVESGASHLSSSENQNLSEAKCEPSGERDTGEKLISHVGTAESSRSSPLTSDSAVPESQVEKESNKDSASVQESSDHPAPRVTPEEELPVSQKEEGDVASTTQTRKSRFKKGKPKPNLSQTSRIVHSRPQPRKDAVEKDCNPTPNPKVHEKTVIEVEAEPTCTTFHEKPSQGPGPATDCIPSLGLGSTLTSTEELSATEKKKTEFTIVGDQVESGASHLSSSENQNLSEAKCEPSGEQATGDTGEKLISPVGTAESSRCSPLTSDSAVPESQAEKESNKDSASVQESSDCPAPHVTPEEELPVSQKEEGDVASTTQTRKSRFKKGKPKPNLSQTSRIVHSRPQPNKDAVEKDCNPTPNPKVHEKTVIEVEAEPTCTTFHEKPNQGPGPATDCIPSLGLGSTLTSTEELSATEEKITDLTTVGDQVESGASHLSASENQNLSEAKCKASGERDTGEKLISHVGTAESSRCSPLTSDSTVPESQAEKELNKDSASVQESSNHPAPRVTSEEELPVSQKEEGEVTSATQIRKSRFKKGKPKPNLSQTSRIVHSRPQPREDAVEKDCNPTPNPKVHEKTVIEVEAEPTCTTFHEKPNQGPGPATDCIPSLGLGSTLTSTEELSATEEKKTDLTIVGDQVESGASHLSASENQNLSEAKCEPSWEQDTGDTGEKLISHVGTAESSRCSPLTSDSTVPESQVQKESNKDSASIQESGDHPAPRVTPEEELPVSQKEEGDVASTTQTRKSRFKKGKPKPNLAQTSRIAHSRPQPNKDAVEKDCNPTPNPKVHEKTVIEVKAEPTCTTFHEKPSQGPGPATDCIPSLGLGSTLTSTEELSATEEKITDFTIVGDQVESGASHLSASESQNLSAAKCEPSWEQATGDTGEKLISPVGTAESSRCSPLTSDSAVPESQAEKESNKDSASIQESGDHPAPRVTPEEELPVSQKEEGEVASTTQPRKSRFKKGKPKPNLAQTSRTAHSRPQPRKDAVEKDCNPTPNPKVHEKTVIEVEAEPTCTTFHEKPSQGPGPATDCIPSLGLGSTLTSTEELSTTEEKKTDFTIVGDQVESGASHLSSSENQNLSAAKCEPSGEQDTGEKLISHVGTAESSRCSPLTSDSAVPESQVEKESNKDSPPVQESSDHPAPRVTPEEELPVSQKEEGEVASTPQARKSRFKKPAAPMQLVEKPFSPTPQPESSLNTAADEDAQPSCSKSTGTASVPSLELRSTLEPTEKLPLTEAQITDVGLDSNSEGSQPNAPQRRRRFPKVKPKPNLTSSSSTTQTEVETKDVWTQCQDEVQQSSVTTETYQTAAQSTDDDQPEPTCSSTLSRKPRQSVRGRLVKPKPNLRRSSQPQHLQQAHSAKEAKAGVDAAVSHKPASELRTDIQEPVKGEQDGNQNIPPHDAGSSLGCLTQVPDISTQDASTLSAGHPSLTIFPDMLSQQVPSDPDEPFFILSLTEIPVSSSGEVVDCASEPLPYVPVTDASVQQQSCAPGGILAAAGDGLLPHVAVPVSMEESGEKDIIKVRDTPAARGDSIAENPVDPRGTETTVQETVESNDETEIPPTTPRLIGSGGRAELQVEPNTPGDKQDSETPAAETVPIQDSEAPGSSVQPKASDEVFTEPQKGSGKRSTTSPSPEASTPHDVAPTPSQPPEETRSASSIELTSECVDPTPSTSLCTAEVSTSQSSDCVESSAAEEEPTSVSQYFLSDIFTEVDEG